VRYVVPLPDPYADEPTAELDPDYVKLWREAEAAKKAWEKEAGRLRGILEDQLGHAHAGTINGEKVIYYRPQKNYAGQAIRRAYPELTEHFLKRVVVEEFQAEEFARAHPDLAEPYRVRSFRNAE
jgi:hypothetical protein